MSSTTADPVGMETSSANEQPTVNDQESSVPTTAAPSAEVVVSSSAAAAPTALKKNSNSKSKKKRQHGALQSMISQLKQLCNQVGQQTSFIDAATGKPINDLSNNGSPLTSELDTHAPASPYNFNTLCVERGMRIPPSVWRPQIPAQVPGAHPSSFRAGLPPPKEIRLTAAEREALQKEEREKEVRNKLRCAVSVDEFEALIREAEAANMSFEVELARRKIEKLTKASEPAATTT